MGKNIIVTGGAGYIGSFMVRRLSQAGYQPIIVDNLCLGHRDAIKDFRLENLDIVTDVDKLNLLFTSEKIDGVVHMASFTEVGGSVKDPSIYYRNNVVGFVNLLDAMKLGNVKNIILSSSAAVYGIPTKLPIEEGDPKNPISPYGETKYILERMLEDYDIAYGIKFVSLRYFNAAGGALDGAIGEDRKNETHLIPNIIRKTLNGEEIVIFGNDYDTPDGTNIRDYVHVLDLAQNHALALSYLEKGGKSNFYNVGMGQGYSNNEIIKEIEKVSGLKVNVKYGPRRAGDPAILTASIDKIKAELGWTPKYSLEDIIKTAFLWHSTHPQGY